MIQKDKHVEETIKALKFHISLLHHEESPIAAIMGEGELLVQKFRDRVDHGLRKYGVTLERTDLTREDWLLHTIEEHMDAANYLSRLIDNPGESPAAVAAFKLLRESAIQALLHLWPLLHPQDIQPPEAK